MEPFLKWAGGKRWLVPMLAGNLPKYKIYIEPFLGSGALFFAIEPPEALLSDSNPELINCYLRVKYDCKNVIAVLKTLKLSHRNFYWVRDQFNLEDDLIKKAAYFLFLNRTAWNGLYRVNQFGEFNVPIGTIKKNHFIYDAEHLLVASKLLKRAHIKCCDFERTLSKAEHGDFVYFDPPYVTSHKNNGFIKYNRKLFRHSDELRLASCIHSLSQRKIFVLLSNAAHPLIKQYYDGDFFKNEIERHSTIAASPLYRNKFKELLVSNFCLDIIKPKSG